MGYEWFLFLCKKKSPVLILRMIFLSILWRRFQFLQRFKQAMQNALIWCIKHWPMSEKILKKWTFGWVFPPFCGFSTKIYLVIHGFYNSRFFPSPKKRELQGPPVCKYIVTAVHIRLSQSHFLTDFLNFKAWFILKVLDLCFCKYVFDKIIKKDLSIAKMPKIVVGGYRQHLHIWVDSKNLKTSLNCSIFDQERSAL